MRIPFQLGYFWMKVFSPFIKSGGENSNAAGSALKSQCYFHSPKETLPVCSQWSACNPSHWPTAYGMTSMHRILVTWALLVYVLKITTQKFQGPSFSFWNPLTNSRDWSIPFPESLPQPSLDSRCIREKAVMSQRHLKLLTVLYLVGNLVGENAQKYICSFKRVCALSSRLDLKPEALHTGEQKFLKM